MNTMTDLAKQSCEACEGGVEPLSDTIINEQLTQLDGWKYEDGLVVKTYQFKDHYQAMAFVNAVALISHKENHHPDMTVGYNTVKVCYITHAIDGISLNDLICAAKIDTILSI